MVLEGCQDSWGLSVSAGLGQSWAIIFPSDRDGILVDMGISASDSKLAPYQGLFKTLILAVLVVMTALGLGVRSAAGLRTSYGRCTMVYLILVATINSEHLGASQREVDV